jgi:hypothetical protein
VKPKTNRAGNEKKSKKYDRCQTPHYALDPLIPFVPHKWLIWESASGDGQVATKLLLESYGVVESDLLTGQNFFEYEPDKWDCQITNPPYSVKFRWIARSYQLGKPWALLMPVEAMGAAKAQRLFDEYGIEIILLDKRVNFKMPDKGYEGKGAQFPTAWYTWGLGLGRSLTYGKITRYQDGHFYRGRSWP